VPYRQEVERRNRLEARILSAAIVAVVAALALVSSSAAASEWALVTRAEASAIDARLQEGFRLTNVTEDGSPQEYAATLTRTGHVPAPQWWHSNLTLEEVEQKLAEYGAQLTQLEGYETADGVRYSAVMTGWGRKTSWWIGTREELVAEALRRESRVVDLERHPHDLVSGVMVENTGATSRPWWLYYEQTPEAIASLLAENGARLVDIEPTGKGSFDVVMLRDGTPSWWYAGRTVEELTALANQNGARLTKAIPYVESGKTVYAGIMVPNVSPETRRVNELMRAAVAGQGAWGHYLKRLNGPTLRAVNPDRRFEPASLMKTLLHLRAIDAFDGNLRALETTPVAWFEGIDGSCPQETSPTSSSMADVLQKMMQRSDNRATLGVLQWAGGFASVNEYAALTGATSSSFNHVIGCGAGARTAPNQLTLRDVGLMLERAANGTMLSAAAFEKFKSLMATAPPSRVSAIVRGRRAGDGLDAVRGEATALRVSSTMAARFLSRVRMAWKDGKYTLCDTTACRDHRTLGGWIRVPFKTKWGRVYTKRFVFAAFTENTPSGTNAEVAWDRSMEMFRPTLRYALKSWKRARR
jgi:hypothetical protein